MRNVTVLIADDDKSICAVLEQAILREGGRALITDDTGQLLRWVEAGQGDVVITDVLMPRGNGLDAIDSIKRSRPNLPVIVISAQNTLMTAVRANELGAYEYLPKPFDLDLLMDCAAKAAGAQAYSSATLAHAEPALKTLPASLIGRSPPMQEIYRTLARIVKVDLTVLITGESGTGKELVAHALHTLGARKHKAFIALNMAAIPRELVESELFGHEKGSFTGAVARKAGAFERAEGGTLFLDEIGDMPMEAQTRLLRVLQQGEYTSVGGAQLKKADVRIITATHRDLLQLVRKGAFREDLYYRLNVVPIKVPPLRERGEDIEELAQHFLEKARAKGLAFKQIDAAGMQALSSHSWPGNVRELENFIYRLCSLHAETLLAAPMLVKALSNIAVIPAATQDDRSLSELVRAHMHAYFHSHPGSLPAPGIYARLLPLVEKPLIETVLDAMGGNQLKTAEMLGINRNTLRKKLSELGIQPGARRAET